MRRRLKKGGYEENGHFGHWIIAPEKEENGRKL
jgi:hypothetical protein